MIPVIWLGAYFCFTVVCLTGVGYLVPRVWTYGRSLMHEWRRRRNLWAQVQHEIDVCLAEMASHPWRSSECNDVAPHHVSRAFTSAQQARLVRFQRQSDDSRN